ncbi:MAG: hypothetical protein CMJ49_11695 [Planctomycetaceae bacterium]|nr:hypothetical protein [Planctomycetaceae bacterium]
MPEHCEAPACPTLTDQLTVQAWVRAGARRVEKMQTLVSKWAPPREFGRFDAFDASAIGRLNCTGYFGAVFDGRYVYFSPEQHEGLIAHGNVLRYDTHAPFEDAASYAAYDASSSGGLDCRGYYGAGFDGRFVYFVPRHSHAGGFHTRLLRYDTRAEFSATEAWAAFDIGRDHSSQSAAFDGRYLYLCPGYGGEEDVSNHSGEVIRYDTHAPFDDASSYAWFDATTVGGPDAACFDGAAFDGRWIYFVPLNQSVAARYDTTSAFDDAGSWQCQDLAPRGMGMCVGAVFDGRYIYYAPYQNPRVVRFDTTGDFDDPSAFSCYDGDHTDGLRTAGFDGAYFDGRFVCFIPFIRENAGPAEFKLHGNLLRYDTAGTFDDPQSWSAIDHAHTSGIASYGYNGGAFDGRYFYSAPWRLKEADDEIGVHGNVLRHDTLGEHGSFSLRYGDLGHNGGLCAAAPGPSFLVNTTTGVISIAWHHAPDEGEHHLAGVYDGQQLRLYVDRKCVAARDASGLIQNCDAPVTIGALPAGGARFNGTVTDARIEARAIPAEQLAP